MLQVWWEHELQDVVDGHLGFDVLEFWRLLGDRKQEHVALLVGVLGTVGAPECIPDGVFAVLAAESLDSGDFFLASLVGDFGAW